MTLFKPSDRFKLIIYLAECQHNAFLYIYTFLTVIKKTGLPCIRQFESILEAVLIAYNNITAYNIAQVCRSEFYINTFWTFWIEYGEPLTACANFLSGIGSCEASSWSFPIYFAIESKTYNIYCIKYTSDYIALAELLYLKHH